MAGSLLDAAFLVCPPGKRPDVPAVPEAGGGAAVTVKFELLSALPTVLVTVTRPVVAPDGTVAEIELSATTANVAGTSLKLTAVTPAKLLPAIATVVPAAPLAGDTLAIAGAATEVAWRVIFSSYDSFAEFPAARRI